MERVALLEAEIARVKAHHAQGRPTSASSPTRCSSRESRVDGAACRHRPSQAPCGRPISVNNQKPARFSRIQTALRTIATYRIVSSPLDMTEVMPSFAQSLEKTLHSALQHATDRTHEYATLEHLLLALVDDPEAGRGDDRLRRRPRRAVDVVRQYLDQEYQSLKTEDEADPQPTAGLPAGDPARDPARPVERQGHRDRRQRAGRAVLRARQLRGLFPPAAGHEPARRGQLHQPRHRQGRPPDREPRAARAPRRARGQGRGQGREGRRRIRRSTSSPSTSTRRRWTARSTR